MLPLPPWWLLAGLALAGTLAGLWWMRRGIVAEDEAYRAAEEARLLAEEARRRDEDEAWRQVLAGYPPRVRQLLVERGKPAERPRRTTRGRDP